MPDPLVLPRMGAVRGAVPRSTTWWGRAFVRGLEEAAYDHADLLAGRTLARSGRLGAVMVLTSMASVVVDPGSERAVVAQLKVDPLRDWAAFVAEAVREAGFVAALEAGQLPIDLVENADQAGAELLPTSADLETACGCDSWVQPCVHAIALLYQLAWRIDADPYVLLLLRGRTREWLVDAITGAATPAAPELLDAADRARAILDLARDAPTGHGLAGHGLADTEVAAYDEAVSRLL